MADAEFLALVDEYGDARAARILAAADDDEYGAAAAACDAARAALLAYVRELDTRAVAPPAPRLTADDVRHANNDSQLGDWFECMAEGLNAILAARGADVRRPDASRPASGCAESVPAPSPVPVDVQRAYMAHPDASGSASRGTPSEEAVKAAIGIAWKTAYLHTGNPPRYDDVRAILAAAYAVDVPVVPARLDAEDVRGLGRNIGPQGQPVLAHGLMDHAEYIAGWLNHRLDAKRSVLSVPASGEVSRG